MHSFFGFIGFAFGVFCLFAKPIKVIQEWKEQVEFDVSFPLQYEINRVEVVRDKDGGLHFNYYNNEGLHHTFYENKEIKENIYD